MRLWKFAVAASLVVVPALGQAKYSNKIVIFTPKEDKFSKTISYSGLQEMINPFGGTVRIWMLRTWIDKETKFVTHQLYVSVSYYNSWRFYQSAADDSATELPFTSIDRQLNGCQALCSFAETFGVELSDSILRTKALTGFQVKIYAKSGDSILLDVTPAQIQSQLLTNNQFLPEERHWKMPPK